MNLSPIQRLAIGLTARHYALLTKVNFPGSKDRAVLFLVLRSIKRWRAEQDPTDFAHWEKRMFTRSES